MFRAAQILFASLWLLEATVALGNVNCSSGVHVILARGTGEPQNSSLAGIVSRAIVATIPDSTADEVIYPANFTVNVSLALGVANAQQQIKSYVAACPTSPIVLMGYSQGAQLIGNVLGGGDTHIFGQNSPPNAPLCPSIGSHVVAIVLFGDPNRDLNIGYNADVGGPACNVSSSNPRIGYQAGNITRYADRISEWCQYSDFVCCSTGTTFAGHISYFSGENADTIAQYVAAKAMNATIPKWTPQTPCGDLESSSSYNATTGLTVPSNSTSPSGTSGPVGTASRVTALTGTATPTTFGGSAARFAAGINGGVAAAVAGLVLL